MYINYAWKCNHWLSSTGELLVWRLNRKWVYTYFDLFSSSKNTKFHLLVNMMNDHQENQFVHGKIFYTGLATPHQLSVQREQYQTPCGLNVRAGRKTKTSTSIIRLHREAEPARHYQTVVGCWEKFDSKSSKAIRDIIHRYTFKNTLSF